ncbi:MAG: 30S ribosomal protein S6 [Ardenticatenales bacterium]|nr:30S ribosomal protein S6 [Ardenticatenales bacterium]
MDELRRYELFVIFQPELEEETLEARIDWLNNYISNNKGEIIEVARKGKRRLHYSIRKFNQGIDVIYQINLPASLLAPMERQLNLNEDVLRYLFIRRDELQEAPRLVATPEELRAEVAELRAVPVDEMTGEVAVEETPVDEPAVAEPTVAEPTVAEPIVDEPIVDEPAVDEPAVDEPAEALATADVVETSEE